MNAALQLKTVDGDEVEIERIEEVRADGSARVRIIRWEGVGRYRGGTMVVSAEKLRTLVAKSGARKASLS